MKSIRTMPNRSFNDRRFPRETAINERCKKYYSNMGIGGEKESNIQAIRISVAKFQV